MIGYLLNSHLDVVEVLKNESERHRLLLLVIKDNVDVSIGDLIAINIESKEVEKLINLMVLERKNSPADVPTFSDRFYEHEIFHDIKFKGSTLTLCNTGFDNGLIFLINLFNKCENVVCRFYLLFGKNRSEINKFLHEIKSTSAYLNLF